MRDLAVEERNLSPGVQVALDLELAVTVRVAYGDPQTWERIPVSGSRR